MYVCKHVECTCGERGRERRESVMGGWRDREKGREEGAQLSVCQCVYKSQRISRMIIKAIMVNLCVCV